jgi:site-specific recombinase
VDAGSHNSIYEGSLFCFVVMRSINYETGCFRLCSGCLWKALDQEGCMGLVP